MNWQQAIAQNQMTEHWLYFAIGFGSSSVLWLAFIIGVFLGNYRRRNKDIASKLSDQNKQL